MILIAPVRQCLRLRRMFAPLPQHSCGIALGYFGYNFIEIHRTLRRSAAMGAGVFDRLWEVADLVVLWEVEETERAA